MTQLVSKSSGGVLSKHAFVVFVELCSKFLLSLLKTTNPGDKVSRKTELVSIKVNVTLD